MADATSRPMKIPITFVPYLEKYNIYQLFQELLSRLIIKRPEDHLHFLRDEILEMVQPHFLRNACEHEAREKSKGSKSHLSQSMKSSSGIHNSESNTQSVESDRTLGDKSENEVRMTSSEGSIEFHMNETLAGMNDAEFEKFSEEVICTWRTIRRTNKFFNIRELPAYQHAPEERRYPEESDTDSDEEINGSNSITLIFHTKESSNEITNEDNQEDMVGSANGSDLKVNHSLKSLEIKIKTDERVPSDSSIVNGDGDGIVTVSNEGVIDETIDMKISNEQIIQVKVLQGIPSNVSNEIKKYIMKLIQDMVEQIILDLPKYSLPPLNLKYFRQPISTKKILHFPRGPVLIPRVILLGPPGSGTYPQAEFLAKRLKLIHVDMRLLLLAWDKTPGQSEIGHFIKTCSLEGDALMNEFSLSILKDRLLREDCLKNGWVLTGYPASAAHARSLDSMETPPNRIIYLDKPLEQCKELIATRMYDVDTGEVGYIHTDPPGRQDMLSRSNKIMSEIENIEDIFGVMTNESDAISGFIMELGKSSGKDGLGLFEHIMECLNNRKRLLRSPEDDPKYVDRRFQSHEAFKSDLLKYYGGWCNKLNVGSLSPTRVHEAILNVVMGPFPSFEEAVISDRNMECKLDSINRLESQLEAKIKNQVMNLFSKSE